MDKVKIRGWTQADLEEVVALWLELAYHVRPMDGFYKPSPDAGKKYKEYLRRALDDRKHAVFVAESDMGLVGFAMGRINESPSVVVPRTVGYIENVFIRGSRRHSGIGTALCKELLAWFKSWGVGHVELFYQFENKKAAAFWNKLGFKTWLAKAYKTI
jgi:GNAT superfamily N-acetyltransferase